MMSGAKKRVPKRRFKEFLNAGDWEQRKLGDIVDFLDGQRKPLKESDRIKGKYPYYGASGIIDYINDYLFDENLVLLSEDGANIIDRNYPVCFIATGKYWVNNHAHVLKAKAGVIDKFICESLERLDYTKFNTGTAQPKLNQDICQKIVITIPNEDEQKCISEFLNRINNIITLHQRKLDKLQATKKALLQEMFPEEGQDKPKRRFKGFTDAWEQCKLGDLLILLKDGSHGTHKNTDDGVYLLSAKNIKNGQINIMPDDRIISWEDYDVIHKNYELQFGDILLTIVGSIGETAIYNLKTKVTFQRSVAFLRPSSDLNNGFLYILINTDRFQNQLQTKQVVSAQPGIYLGDLASIDIIYPKNLLEQEKIYSIFKEIENSITLHQRKLDKLKNLKQAYLNEMFV